MRGRPRALLAAFAAVVVSSGATACGGQTQAGVQPQTVAPRESSARGVTVPNHGAPHIEKPLDARKFLTAPCSTLTATQLDALNLHTTGKPTPDWPQGPECHWGDTAGATMGGYTTIFLNDGYGISSAYGNRNSSFFEELSPIAGYPAVIAMPEDSRAEGDCNLVIGLNDHLAVDVGAVMIQGAPNFANSCGVAAKIGEKIVETIKGAQ